MSVSIKSVSIKSVSGESIAPCDSSLGVRFINQGVNPTQTGVPLPYSTTGFIFYLFVVKFLFLFPRWQLASGFGRDVWPLAGKKEAHLFCFGERERRREEEREREREEERKALCLLHSCHGLK